MNDYLEFEVTDGESEEHFRYCVDKNFACLHNNKIFMFHTEGDGSPSHLSSETLYQFFKQGYIFVTCYPKNSKRYLGFGNFIFENHLGLVSSAITNKKMRILRGYATEYQLV